MIATRLAPDRLAVPPVAPHAPVNAVVRSGFHLSYEPISALSEMGAAAIVPWDTNIFGINIASFRPGPEIAAPDQALAFREAFINWMRPRHVALCSAVLAPAQSPWRDVLAQADFQFVDLSTQVTLSLGAAKLPPVRSILRLAQPDDRAAIEAIAAESFSHGRYHADPRFPNHLADRRYSHWVRNVLTAPSEIDRMYVMEDAGQIAGFYHVTIEGPVSDLRLAALAPGSKATMLGVELYAAMLHELRGYGVRRVIASISAMNTNVVNLFSMLGFRFAGPEIVYHWHSPGQAQ